MKVTLKLRFSTQLGQSLWVTGDHAAFGAGDVARALPLRYVDRDHWQITFEAEAATGIFDKGFNYWYILRQPDGGTVSDWGAERELCAAMPADGEILIIDSWNAAGFPENTFYTQPFKQVLLRDRQTSFVQPARGNSTHTFRVRAPLLGKGQTLALVGSAAALGTWDCARPVLLDRPLAGGFLTASLNLKDASFPIEYKYGVFDTVRNVFLGYEGGSNRRLWDGPVVNRPVIVNDGFAVLPAETWKGAGVAIPVFSLRSESSFGVGEFTDLELLADWCQETGLKLIQILPVNDTTATHTWVDSYPYAAISAFALHPIYLNLSRVANQENQALLRELEPERLRLNGLPEVDWESVLSVKLGVLDCVFLNQGEETFQSAAFCEFFAQNAHWLRPYAVFCHLRDRYGTADFARWPAHGQYRADDIAALCAPESREYDAIALYFFIQFHLDLQLRDAVAHAHARGVVLKGDIPIGVARYGADTWEEPELYDLKMQSGAPPDPFADRGQNWGFPTYNWPVMMRNGFAWWKRRFAQMGHYFDAFRIDHLLGFFRIWSIPVHAVEGILGHFVPAIPLDPEELVRNGTPFDRDRLVEPFITDAVLRDLFGERTEMVKATYLQTAGRGSYSLVSSVATQRQVEEHFASLEMSEERRQLKQGLFDLIANVILLEVEENGRVGYHFRFGMEQTSSFRWLDETTRARLAALYLEFFYRRQDGFWQERAMEKLPVLKRVTGMLICGEDLGFVPACVPGVMRDLGLLSLEIQRMPKDPTRAFSSPSSAPYLSVVTPSTHDMSTIRGWWTENAAVTQRFYNAELGRPGLAPESCSGELNEAVVRQHLASPAMWSVFQLQDLLGMDEALRRPDPGMERINVPAIPNYRWRYRLHLPLERLLEAESFNQHLRCFIHEYGR